MHFFWGVRCQKERIQVLAGKIIHRRFYSFCVSWIFIGTPIDGNYNDWCQFTSIIVETRKKGSIGSKEGSIEQKQSNNLDPKTVSMPSGTKTYINESLYTCYKKLWSKCKKL